MHASLFAVRVCPPVTVRGEFDSFVTVAVTLAVRMDLNSSFEAAITWLLTTLLVTER